MIQIKKKHKEPRIVSFEWFFFSTGFCLIYDSFTDAKAFEPKHRLLKIGVGAKPTGSRKMKRELKNRKNKVPCCCLFCCFFLPCCFGCWVLSLSLMIQSHLSFVHRFAERERRKLEAPRHKNKFRVEQEEQRFALCWCGD